jgi:CO/xanthine dehydrogenase Mo-binding subunit
VAQIRAVIAELPTYGYRRVSDPQAPGAGRGFRAAQSQADAGKPSSRPVAAAIANAIFDATGVRIRRVPFSPGHAKSALS